MLVVYRQESVYELLVFFLPDSYSQFKAIIQEYEKNHNYKYHNAYEPDRGMQFDFTGDNLWIDSR